MPHCQIVADSVKDFIFKVNRERLKELSFATAVERTNTVYVLIFLIQKKKLLTREGQKTQIPKNVVLSSTLELLLT